MKRAFINRLCELARQDDRICMIIGDLGFSVVEPFAKEFPDRFLNAGVAEQNMIGMATGWSLAEGKIIFVYSIANFPTLRCLEQIRNDVCYHKANVKIVSVGCGLTYGSAGFSHHATEDLAIMRSMPGMVVTAPSDAFEVNIITKIAVETSGPFYIRIGNNNEPSVSTIKYPLNLKMPVCYKDEGDILLFGIGTILNEVLLTAEMFDKDGIKVAVAGIPFLKPIDVTTICELIENKKIVVTVEEHSGFGGLGSSIAEIIAEHNISVPYYRINLPEYIETIGSQDDLRNYYKLDAKSIYSFVLDKLHKIK